MYKMITSIIRKDYTDLETKEVVLAAEISVRHNYGTPASEFSDREIRKYDGKYVVVSKDDDYMAGNRIYKTRWNSHETFAEAYKSFLPFHWNTGYCIQ
jgi:hypothetical protein